MGVIDEALGLHHGDDDRLIIIGPGRHGIFLLEQAVVPLRIEQAHFIETSFLELMVHIGRQEK